MNDRTRTTKRVTAAGLFAGVAGWAAASQTPPAFAPPSALPIPELPKAAAAPTPARLPEPAVPSQLPVPAAAPPLAPPADLPSPSNPTRSAQPDFNLRTDPARHSLTGDGDSRETLPTPAPAFAELPPPAPPAFPPMPHPETAAMRLDKALFATAIGAALAGGPALAQGNQDDKTKIPLGAGSVKPTDLKKEIDEKTPVDLKKEIESVKTMLEALTAKQKQLGDAVLGKGEGAGADAGLAKKIDDLTTTLKTLDEAVKKLDDKMTKLGDAVEKTRTSLSSPLTNKDVTKPSTGIVKLINGYGERVTMVLNGTSYRLEPNETKDVTVPAGVFDYALPLAGGEVKKSQVKGDEIVTLRIK